MSMGSEYEGKFISPELHAQCIQKKTFMNYATQSLELNEIK